MTRRTWSEIGRIVVLCMAAFPVVLPSAMSIASERDRERWDSRYEKDEYLFGKDPIAFLAANADLLPKGRALDLAAGEGRNSVFLASQGFKVVAADISEKGLHKARTLAAERGVTIETAVMDLEQADLGSQAYDVIVCTYYTQRDLIPKMKAALKPGGMIVMEQYTVDYLKYASFNRKYLLEQNELLEWFKDLKIVRYQAVDNGKTAFASIIAQKP